MSDLRSFKVNYMKFNKFKKIAVVILFALVLLVSPAVAEDNIFSDDSGTYADNYWENLNNTILDRNLGDDYINPIIIPTIDTRNIEQFVPWNDSVMSGWLYVNPATNKTELNLTNLATSTITPFTRIVGSFFVLIMFALSEQRMNT